MVDHRDMHGDLSLFTSGLIRHDQQNHCSLGSWLLRSRDSGVDNLPGLGPIRAASLKDVFFAWRCWRPPRYRGSPDATATKTPHYFNTSIVLSRIGTQSLSQKTPVRLPTGCGFDRAAWPLRSHKSQRIPQVSQHRSPAISCSIPLIVP